MKLVNHTPFPAMVFEAHDPNDRALHVLVLRATLEHRPEGLRLSRQQRPLTLGDEHYGDPAVTAPREESDLAPYKPTTDILVRGTARAPRGTSLPAWEVSARVGAIEKRVRVTGARKWVRAGGAWTLTEPAPCESVPLRYELAYGGTARDGEREERCEENPVGVGFAPAWWRDGRDEITAPQIESPDDPLRDLDRAITPAGVGAVGKAWLPRRTFAGTYDDAWVRERWPVLPPDFDARFWNCASPGLIAPSYLRGDEAVTLTGVHPDGAWSCTLPGHKVFVLVRLESGAMVPFDMNLDTLTLCPDPREVSMAWRFVAPVEPPIRVLEARMIFQKP
jgi:hypothetical protein